MPKARVALFTASIAFASSLSTLYGEAPAFNLNAPLRQNPAWGAFESELKTLEAARPKLVEYPLDIPEDRLAEIGRQLKPLGWSVSTEKIGDWPVYVMKHGDGTVWRSNFAHKFYRQAHRLLNPEWIPIENYELDCLLLEKRPLLEAAGWHAEFILTPGTTQFPDLSFLLKSKAGKTRLTQYSSELRYWLNNGPQSCWHPDRPFPNCEF